MTKQDIIEDIRRHNRSARQEFLVDFKEEELLAYLHQLRNLASDPYRPVDPETKIAPRKTSPRRPFTGPAFTSYKQYMGRPARHTTTYATKRRRLSPQLG